MSKHINLVNHNDLVNVFEKFVVRLPRQLRIDAMKDVLKPLHEKELIVFEAKVKEDENSLAITDYTRLHRLRAYKELSEFQLENEMRHFADDELVKKYVQKLWTKVDKFLSQKNGFEEVIEAIKALPQNKNETKIDFSTFNALLFPYFVDAEGVFDGIDFDEAPTHFVKTATRKELFELGKKYDVIIPKYLRKADLKERLLEILESRDALNDTLKSSIEAASLKELRVLLEENNADSEPYITKEKMVKIMLDSICCQRDHEEKDIIEVVTKLQESNEGNCEDLKTIIANQEKIIKMLESSSNNITSNKVFNYIVISLIVLVTLIWIIYGITTLF